MDLSKAVAIKQEIEDTVGCSCWMDMDGIESGSQFEDIIVSAIDNAQVVLFLLSENSMSSRWTKDEVRYAYETQKKIVPANIDGSTLKGWFLFKFSGRDVIDYSNRSQRKKMMSDLYVWCGSRTSGKKEINGINQRRKWYTRVYDSCCAVQFLGYALLVAFFSTYFFYGFISKAWGHEVSMFNMLLCALLLASSYATWLLFKRKIYMTVVIFVLDTCTLLALCAVARRVYDYTLVANVHYTSLPYIFLYRLGHLVVVKLGAFKTFCLLELTSLLHLLTMVRVVYYYMFRTVKSLNKLKKWIQ